MEVGDTLDLDTPMKRSIREKMRLWWWKRTYRISNFFKHDDWQRATKAGWPPSLIKACCDQFGYAVKLRSGEHWYVSEAAFINKDWVHLKMADVGRSTRTGHPPHCFDRGVDVRVDQIVWFADAPDGS